MAVMLVGVATSLPQAVRLNSATRAMSSTRIFFISILPIVVFKQVYYRELHLSYTTFGYICQAPFSSATKREKTPGWLVALPSGGGCYISLQRSSPYATDQVLPLSQSTMKLPMSSVPIAGFLLLEYRNRLSWGKRSAFACVARLIFPAAWYAGEHLKTHICSVNEKFLKFSK